MLAPDRRRIMRTIFISHAADDKELADLLENLIETGIGVPHNEIFCTSSAGLTIPEGVDFKEHIRKELEHCDSVIALISHNYYASPFCMCELGAAWVLAKNFFPLLVPPVDVKDLRGVLTGMECRNLRETSTASALYTRLSKLIKNPVPIERWDVKKDVFYKNLTDVLAHLPKPKTVKAEDLIAVQNERDRFKSMCVELEQGADRLRQQVRELSSAKDPKDVNEINKKYSSEWERYESLVAACRSSLKQLPTVVREAIYYWARGEAYSPNDRDDDLTDAIENDLVRPDRYNDYRYVPNEERPTVGRAVRDVTALQHFLTKEGSMEFYDEAIRQLGDTPDIKRRSYWDEELW